MEWKHIITEDEKLLLISMLLSGAWRRVPHDSHEMWLSMFIARTAHCFFEWKNRKKTKSNHKSFFPLCKKATTKFVLISRTHFTFWAKWTQTNVEQKCKHSLCFPNLLSIPSLPLPCHRHRLTMASPVRRIASFSTSIIPLHWKLKGSGSFEVFRWAKVSDLLFGQGFLQTFERICNFAMNACGQWKRVPLYWKDAVDFSDYDPFYLESERFI